MTKALRTAALAALLAVSFAPAAQSPRQVFVVHSDEFWLNLHHFLYVLGQAQGRAPNQLREAVRNAPAEAASGLEKLTGPERETWADAVDTYANGLSKSDPVVDEPLARMTGALAAAGDARALRGARVDADVREVLERAAPIYRKAWWPAHRVANEAYDAALQPLVARHGAAIVEFLTTRYAEEWPADGYPVHLAAYTTWAGAYSTWGNLLVVATNEGSGMHGSAGLEMAFHEAMHQWDDATAEALREQAQRIGAQVPEDLSHSLIFYTSGEAVRRVMPEHVPFGEARGRWSGRNAPVRAAFDEVWKPYLDGGGTRDEALGEILARLARSPSAQPQAPRPAASPLFTFETDEFWLNLHHFLYVLGRTEAGLAASGRTSAAASAPAEAERGLRSLTPDERRAWADAVSTYATGLSLRNTLERAMAIPTRALADADDAATLSGVALDAPVAAALERAAPIYRKTWWPAHLAANRAWRSSTQALVDSHGAAIIDYVTKAYELPWPTGGFAVHVSGYANYGTAYSSGISGLLIIPSQSEFNTGLHGLETIVHEAMHQWDGRMFEAMRAHASGSNVPPDMPHALIFYTAGEAVRRVEPSHVPIIDWLEIWALRLSGATLPAERLKPLLVEIWKPHLDGRGTRDEALAGLVPRAIAVSQP